TGLFAGAALALAGAVFQSLVRNPLGSPDVLGFTSGAATGALTAIVVVGATGFLLAAWLTPRAPAWAFFMLPTRMGELLAGALLAVLGTQLAAIPAAARRAMVWGGLVVIALACVRFDEAMTWPGTAVLVPVMATMAVIAGGSGRRRPPVRALAVPALQWLGRHSYALYLWHWPVLVFAAGRAGHLAWHERVVAVGLAVGLATLSLRLVEDPVRHARWLAAVPRRSLALGAAMVLVMLLAGWGLARSIPPLEGEVAAVTPQLVAAPPAVASTVAAASPTTAPGAPPATPLAAVGTAPPPPPTTVAATLAPATTVVPLAVPDPPSAEVAALVASMQQALATASTPTPLPSNLRPSLGAARDRALPYTQGCVNVGVNPKVLPCEFGTPGAATTILLYGDSHAVQWFEPLQQIALQRGVRLVVLAKGGCPVVDVVVRTPVLRSTCPPYRDGVINWIAEHQPAVVVVANSYTQYEDDPAAWATGAETTIGRLAAVAPRLVVIGDNPSSTVDPPACLSGHRDDVTACATRRADAVHVDRISGEVAAARAHGARFVDVSDWFCTPVTCPAVVGDLLVLRDETHLTPPMAEFLTPLLDAALAPVLATLG
ncbi:MAG TPA: acyltransferase family protein, partial [Ilumatobacteraceae bacterium]|nr:acyltransferase family protein [Ilumatobacteraceae bacterium]